jgi:hypothetical protein
MAMLGRKKSIYQRITIDEAKARLRSEFEPPWDEIDPFILPIVRVFYLEGIETFQSCQGGIGHSFPEPTVEFSGGMSVGFRALHIALEYDLKPFALRRAWSVLDKEPVGPHWEMTFRIPDCPTWDWRGDKYPDILR